MIYRGENDIQGSNFINTSPYTGNLLLSPNTKDEIRKERGEITQEEYEELYYKKLYKNFKENKSKLIPLIYREELILTCHCSKDNHTCHVNTLVKYLTNNYPGVEYKGIWVK